MATANPACSSPRQILQSLFPGLLLVALMTLINVVVALSLGHQPATSLVHEVLATVAFAALVGGFLFWGDRHLVRELRSPSGLTLSTVVVAAGALLTMVLFMAGYVACLRYLGFDVHNPIRRFAEADWPVDVTLVMLAVAPAVTEEIAFRGILLSRLDRVFGRSEALLVQAALFGIVHMLPMMFVSHFVLGLALGWVRRRTGSLYLCMFAHGAYNTWALLW
jgi:membrane protease YdiL (CAAX protease family)